MNNLIFALNVVFPIFVLLIVGYISSHMNWISKKALNDLNRFVFRLPLPLLLFLNIYNIESGTIITVDAVKTIIVIFITLIAITAIMPVVLNRTTTLKNGQKGVLTQAWFRCNTIIFGLPIVLSLYGADSLNELSIIIVAIVPLLNVLAVLVLELYRGKEINLASLILSIFKNPLIIGALLGFIFHILKITIPTIILKPISDLSKTATPLAFIVLGGTLEFSKLKGNIKLTLIGCFGRLIVTPLIASIFLLSIGIKGIYLGCLIACLAAPVSVSSFTMACEMDGDGELASHIVVVSTALSIFTMFIWIFISKRLNLI
jgi:predicted permease